MAEKKIPWWRKALNFALGSIRSGFGLFSRSAKPEPVAEPTFSDNLKETPEEETVLSNPFPQPEITDAAKAIPAEREAEPTPAAALEPMPEPVGVSEAAAEPALAAEPIPVSAPAIDEAVSIDSIPAEAEHAAEKSMEPNIVPEGLVSGAKEVAEKPGISGEIGGKCPSVAKASDDSVGFLRGLKPPPPSETSSSVACEAPPESEAETTPLPAAEPDPVAEVVAETSETMVVPIQAAEAPAAHLTAVPEPTTAPEAEAKNEAASEPVEAEEAVAEDKPEPAPEPIVEVILEQAPVCIEDSEPVAEPEVAETPESEAVDEAVSEPVEVDEVVLEAEPETTSEPIAEAISEQAAVCVADSDPETEPEVAETPEAEAENEAASEPVEVDEVVVEAEPEPAPEPIAEPDSVAEVMAEPMVVPVPAAAITAVPEPSTAPEAENEAASEPVDSTEPAVEAEQEATAEQTPDPDTAPDVAPPLVLTSQLMADEKEAEKAEEKAAAKLAARQKKLDESSEQSPFSVIVGKVYDGPLDLLLDLIRKQDIDIYDIPIARITAQFLAYVNQLKAGDVDVAGEFIYTASLLIHIKSRMLLPRAAAGPEDEAEDPRRELVERLLEHERFKNAAQMLQQKQMLEAATWSNPGASEFKDDAGAEPEIAADTVDLVRIFRDILERARKRPAFDVEEDSVTVGQMIQFLARRLTMEDKPVALRRLLSHTRSERALIAMFLALLELVRLQAILLRQDRQFSEIFIKKNTDFDTVMNEGLSNARDDWR
jgi:segregation and condensation protein A